MKKINNTNNPVRRVYVQPHCKTRTIAEALCNASVPDVEPGGDMDNSPSNSPTDGKEGLWT